MKKILKSKYCSVKVLLICLAVLLVVLVGVLILSFYGIPKIIDVIVHQNVELKDNTEQWDRFIDLPIPITLNAYIFNVTNSDAVLRGEKPILVEVGPYVYKEQIHRNVLSTDHDSITYQQSIGITFDQELSGNLKETDEICIINPALLVLTQITSPLEQLAITGCLDKLFSPEYNKLFVKVNIKTVMFDGIPFAQVSPDVGYACNVIRNQVIEKTKKIRNVQRIYNKVYNDVVDGLIFALLRYKSAAPDGVYTINRGIDDVSQLGQIMRWNYSSHLPYWGRSQSKNIDSCQLVHGGDSTIYPPHVTKDDILSIFATDVCRNIDIFYTGKDTYKNIDGLKFEPKSSTFRSTLSNIEDDCFCIKLTKNAQGQLSCYLDGVLDMYECFGVPILLSFPHFLYADESYINGVEGLTAADPQKHGIYLLIEPNTGTPLEGRKRVQFNMITRPVEYMSFTKKIYSTVMPLVWIEEAVDLTDDLVEMVNNKYFKNVKIATGVKYGLIAVSASLVIVVTTILVRKSLF